MIIDFKSTRYVKGESTTHYVYRGMVVGKIRPGQVKCSLYHIVWTYSDWYWADYLVLILRGNTIRGNTTLNSENKMAFWEVLWEDVRKTSQQPLKFYANLWSFYENPQNPWISRKTTKTTPLRGPVSNTLRGGFPSQNLSGFGILPCRNFKRQHD